MLQENKKISTNISKIVKQIKKEHFIKIILWIITITLIVVWISMILATSIDDFVRNYTYGEPIIISDLKELSNYELGSEVGQYKITYSKISETIIVASVSKILTKTPNNPMLLIGDKELMGYWLAILLAPMGFLSLLGYISYQKNMITPNAIKKTNRKALQFNYLKQQQVDRIIDEIDINIGIKEITYEEEKE